MNNLPHPLDEMIERDILHSQHEYKHSPYDQSWSEIKQDDGLGCVRGCLSGIIIMAVISAVIAIAAHFINNGM